MSALLILVLPIFFAFQGCAFGASAGMSPFALGFGGFIAGLYVALKIDERHYP